MHESGFDIDVRGSCRYWLLPLPGLRLLLHATALAAAALAAAALTSALTSTFATTSRTAALAAATRAAAAAVCCSVPAGHLTRWFG